MCKGLLCILVSALSLVSAFRLSAAEQVTISEFLASNTSGIRDEDNTYPDWIELRNAGTNSVNLDGWFLTDAAGNLTKWRIPATNITAGGFLIIFADGKDRSVPGRPLHTSFNLSAGGEYLALVKPDGVTIATEFRQVNNGFPSQAPNVSYGYGTLTTNATAMTSNALVRWRIPNGTEGTNWMATNYDATAWAIGTNGVGYGATNSVQADYSQAVLPLAPVVYYRLDESSGATAVNLGSSGAAQNGAYNGATLGTAGPRPPTFNGFEPNNNAPTLNGASHVAGPAGFFSGRTAFTVGGWIKPNATPAARTGLFGQNDCVEFGFITGTTLECWTPGGGSITAVPYPHPVGEWHHVLAVANGSNIRIFIDGQVAGTGGSGPNYGSSGFNFNIGGGGIQDATGNFFNGQIDEVVAFHRALSDAEILSLFRAGTNAVGGSAASFVRTQVGPVMSNVNASAYIRIPFVVDNPTNVTQLTVRMRHDDGFVAFLNGSEVLRVNAPTNLAFNSAATNAHSPLSVDEFRLGGGTLVPGTNLLAIQGLNLAANDEDFLIAAEVIVTSATVENSVALYFPVPTPGAANEAGIANPGPLILNPTHFPNVPRDDEELTVTARIAPAFFPVASVALRYRVMFGSEVETPMFDDGAHGDSAAGDGVFGATIPSSAATNGQMIRWFYRAVDVMNNTSRWPIFVNQVDSPEYFGTIVDPTNVTSKLPIVHIFAPPNILQPGPTTTASGADSQAGSRVSLFFDGEFYDNIHMALRGNTTAGYNKKSHRLEFTRDHPFRYNKAGDRIRRTSFVADFPDPTYMRQGLAFWLCNEIGSPAPYYDPMRLQLNGQFYQLANHNDVHTEDMLERLGYDPNGALYNAAGVVLTSQFSTGGFEKKSRRWESNADYVAFANAVNESVSTGQRRTNIFDMADIPNMLNYLVAARWSHENDDVWANMSLYHDNDGDGLWRIIGFDMNLSWGAIFYEGGNTLVIEGVQATNDIHKAHPFYGGSSATALSGPGAPNNFNRVYDTFFQVPEFRQMYLRRMRTMLDKYIGQIGTPTNSSIAEQRILYLYDQMREEAVRDRAWWGWPNKGGQCNFDPGISITNGVNAMLDQFVRARRGHFLGKHSITNTALPIGVNKDQNAGIPLSQPDNAVIQIAQIEFNPSSGNQGHEFIQVSNPNPYAVDISGWRLDGGVDFTFKPGTVLVSNGTVYVTPDRNAFRTRTAAPRTNQALFVVGNYQGTLDARGEPLRIFDDAGRLVSTNTYIGNPSAAQQFLRITEIMYNPGASNAACAFDRQEFEYIELKNIGSNPLNLVGIHFTNGIEFAFTTNSAVTNLAPGQVVVLVKNSAAFTCRYGAGATIAGVFSNNLDNAGERIKLDDIVGEQIMDFSYNNSWYPITDGLGFSLVIVNENAAWNTWDEKESWRASGSLNGSPGVNEPAAPLFAPVLVNEVLANSVLPAVDAIELWNSGTNTADVSGWWISDDFFSPFKYRVPPNTTIPVGGYLVFDEDDFNPGGSGFAFSAAGDEAYIFSADGLGNLTGYYHGFDFNASEPGVSWGRYLTSDGSEHFVAQRSNTLNAVNAGPRVGPIVISEIMYHPPDIAAGDDSDSEFVELHNISTNEVSLFDAAFPTNTWRLDDAVNFRFATNATIPAGGFLVVVGFDPGTNATALSNFRTKYGIGLGVPIVGPWDGQLDNSEDSVELKKPDTSVATNITSVLVERVHYDEAVPWPAAADGYGPSLVRIVEADFGDDATNWVAGAPTPGAASAIAPPPVITSHPASATVVAGNTTNFTVVAQGSNLSYQWFRNGISVPNATGATLTLTNTDLGVAGTYNVVVLSGGGAVVSSNAQLTVLFPVTITAQPQNQNVLPGTNVTISVGAIGNGTLRFQWRFEGVDIPGATNFSYSFVNANLNEHHGNYSVVVTDDVSTTVSSNAFIYVLVRPVFVINPVPTTVLAGGTAVLTAYATGAPPIYYRWLRQGSPLITNQSGILILTNVTTTATIRVLATNVATGPAGISMVPSTGVAVTVLPDADRDGMADAWETNYFGTVNTTNNAGNATQDPDGDGMINRDEYVAGTNPTNALSLLKLFLVSSNSGLLEFVAQTNVGYTLQYRTNLNTTNWIAVTNVAAQPSQVRTIQVAVPYPAPDPERYYRVVTPPAP